MLKKYRNVFATIKRALLKRDETHRYNDSHTLTSAHVGQLIYVHNGLHRSRRRVKCLFIGRNIKFNVIFKRPLVRPDKRRKAKKKK